MGTPEESAVRFAGQIPELYDTLLVPMLFDPYAVDVCSRVQLAEGSLLEVAAGTGAVTRRLAAALPETVTIVATDLNQPMLDRAAARGTTRPVTWRQADAMALPFDDASFDVVVCQFGAMFFPDKATAYASVRRVLRPGGRFVFDVWGPIDDSPLAACVRDALADVFDDPPQFLARVPHGYHDPVRIAADLAAGGFAAPPQIDVVDLRCRAASAAEASTAFCYGTPTRNDVEARDPAALDRVAERVTALITERFGATDVDAPMRALVVTVEA
ncbi:MAG: class I SAM-dependent methyltransferase [Ilumatobacteraceae bacterium]